MTFKQTYILSNEKQLLIKLPENFKKALKVLVSVKEVDEGRAKKINMLANAAKDPLFVSDVNEIREDFKYIDADQWLTEVSTQQNKIAVALILCCYAYICRISNHNHKS